MAKKKLTIKPKTKLPKKGAGGTFIKSKLQDIPQTFEGKIDNWLGNPMLKAQERAQFINDNGEVEDEIDNQRHAISAKLTAEAIRNKTGNIPIISNALGFIGASAAGLAHEIQSPNKPEPWKKGFTWSNTIREGAEDQFNNMIGAGIGSLPFISSQKGEKIIRDLSLKNYLPDGYDFPKSDNPLMNDMYFKPPIDYGVKDWDWENNKIKPGLGQSIQSTTYKNGGLLKAGNGLNTPIKGTKEQLPKFDGGGRAPIRGSQQQLQSYNDSLDLYNTNRSRLSDLRQRVQRATNEFGVSGLYDNGVFSENMHFHPPHQIDNHQYSTENVPESYTNGNDQTYWGYGQNHSAITPEHYEGFDRRFRQNIIRGTNQTVNLPNQQDLHEYTGLWQFPRPVQPIIYQPQDSRLPSDQRINPMDLLQRHKEQPINIQSAKPDLLQGTNNLEFNPIPYKKGSYFTTNDDEQERDAQGKKGVRYWDKKTGRQLKKFGGLTKAKDGLITDPRQDSYYTPSRDNTKVNSFKEQDITNKNLPVNKSLKLRKDIQNTPVKATGAIEESLSPIDLIGTGLYKNLAKGAFNIGDAAIQNTWRINPYAFKPTEGMLYRGIGKEGMEDALQSQVFRAKQNVQPDMVGNFDFAKRFKNTYYSPKFNVADSYGNGFIAEVPENAANFANRYAKGKDWSKLTTEQIPINKGKILEKDWLKRYKEVKQPNLSKPQGQPEIIKETKPYNYQFDGQTDKLGDYLRPNTPLDDSYIIKKKFGGNVNTDWEIVQDDNEWELV